MCIRKPCLMPPHPDIDDRGLRSRVAKTAGVHGSAVHAGMDEPQPFDMRGWLRRQPNLPPTASGAASVRQFNILTILVAFPDKSHRVLPTFFDGLLYGNRGIKPSVRDYYADQSGEAFQIATPKLPSAVGWQRLPQTYAYYTGGNYGWGAFPRNAQGMVRDAVIQLARGGFDFRPFDNDGDGIVDGLVVIHAGSGAELTSNVNDIWSHSWAIPRTEVGPGLYVQGYTTQPEYWRTGLADQSDMTIGVNAHEIFHMIGLPDWYSTANDGFGLGKWDPMAGGSWNGGLGQCPPNLNPWGMMRLGFAEPSIVTQPGSYTVSGPRQFLWIPIASGDSRLGYAIVHRHQSGWDKYLPTSGVLIFKVDGRKNGNVKAWVPGRDPANHYEIAICECDGDYSLPLGSSSGEPSDAWPDKPVATWIRDFSDSDFYGSPVPFIIRNITENTDQTAATLDIEFKSFALPGDINNDGQLTAEDAVGVVMEAYFGQTPSGRADVDLSGFVDATDVQVIIDKLSDAERARVPALLAAALGG